tara:strand:+ start:249 stop:557 length:309 start_codon:yes stop_codon:yes gene_type:complete
MKIPVVLHPNYMLYIEEFQDKIFMHCDVYKWNKTTKKSLDNSLQQMFNLYGRDLYALHEDTKDNKHRKFLEMYNFKLFSTEKSLDGIDMQVWRNQLGDKRNG